MFGFNAFEMSVVVTIATISVCFITAVAMYYGSYVNRDRYNNFWKSVSKRILRDTLERIAIHGVFLVATYYYNPTAVIHLPLCLLMWVGCVRVWCVYVNKYTIFELK